jgi:hypothetical protein
VHQPPLGPPHYRLPRWARHRWRLATAALAAILLAGGATAAIAAAAQVGAAAQVMAATGQKAFDMAFILADGSSCTPAWDGPTRSPRTPRWPR